MAEITTDDRVNIRVLYDTFYVALNEGDGDSLKSCFAPGGHITRYAGEPSTPEFAAANGAYWAADPVGSTYQHHVTNILVYPDPDGRDDFCNVKMYFFVTGVWEPPHILIRWSCKAYDELQRVDGQWKFLNRQITLNHNSTGPHWENEPSHIPWDFEKNQKIEA
jgi:hypothetical protein